MVNKWQDYLDQKLGHLKKKNKYVEVVEKSITGNVFPKMKEAIAVSEIMTFSTHMRAKVRLPDHTLVPVNGISFIIAGSGTSKDRSLNQARKCFNNFYERMSKYLEKQAYKKAVKDAEADGKTVDEWRLFYMEPKPLFGGAKPTLAGVVAHLNSMQDTTVGGGHIYSGEFGAELANGSAMLEILQFSAEIYDLGNIKADWRKTAEAQGKEIKSMNFSAVFITSPGHIIYDQTIKKKFIMEFTTKLARRSFFNFNKEDMHVIDETVEELMAREKRELDESVDSIVEIQAILDKIVPKAANILNLEEGLWEVYGVVKRYYEERSEEIDPELESYRLTIAHTQWRALKLAGAYAQIDNRTTINIQDFAEALHYCESTEPDIREFNIELNKESYELLDDYVNSIYKEHPIELTAHRLSKLGYINSVSGVKTKLKELSEMANDISTGIYSADGTKIKYERLQEKEFIGASYRASKGTKDERARNCAEGYEYKETDFERIAVLMSKDTVYCPFEFKDGVRGNANIIGGTKWVCLDIDDSDVTDEEAHDMLSDYNHHICRTSDKTNPFKFRIAIELDKYVEIEQKKWKKLLESIGKFIGIPVDLLPPSQIYFGYSDRRVLSNIVGEPLDAKDHIMYANKENEKKSVPTAKESKEMMSNPMDTFHYAYDAEQGGRSLVLIRAARHAKDLGGDFAQVSTLMEDINNYWVVPLEDERFERTILKQVERWYE